MPNARTRGQIEAAITATLTRFEREHLGAGPREARTFIVHDLVVVRMHGVLSPAEQQLAGEAGGIGLIKQVRSRLVEGSSAVLCALVEAEAGVPVTTMHTDVSTQTGERLFVFVLERPLEVEPRARDAS